MLYLIFCSFVFIFIIWWLKRLIEARLSPLIKLPGRQLYNPILGNIPIFETNFHKRWRTHYNKYGTVYRIYVFGGVPWIAVTDPNTMKYVLSTNSKNYVRGPLGTAEAFEWIVGKSSMLLLDGEIHKKHRTIISPAFRQGHLKKLIPIMLDCSQRLSNHWNHLITSDNESHITVDLKKYMSNITLNIIGLAGFGFDFDCIGKKSEFADGIQNVVNSQQLLDNIVVQYVTAYLPFLLTLFHKRISRIVKGIQITRKALKHMVRTKFNSIDQWKDSETSFLELVLGSTVGNESRLTEDELEDELMTFILAGHETSSLALTYAIYFLCKYPDWQDKCRKEVKAVIKSDTELTWETVQEMKCVKCVIYETLRLCPPAPLVVRQSVTDDCLKGYNIPAKTNVSLLIGQMHRLPEFWPEPDEFKPERFMHTEQSTSFFDAFMPFGDGNHKCIGYQFALAEVTVILSMLLNEFCFELVSPLKELLYSIGITMGPKTPIVVKVFKL